MSDFNDQAFIQGFLEEADEHLGTITGILLALEKPPGGDEAEERSGQVGELYRALHSIKGLSTMVGLMPAADLSHAMESVVREIQQERLEVTPQVIDSLLEAAKTLRAVVDTLRAGGTPAEAAAEAIPDIRPQRLLLEQLAERGRLPLAASTPAAAAAEVFPLQPSGLALERLPAELAALIGEAEQRQIRQAQANGRSVNLAIFTPSSELAAQGINVTAIRQRLAAQGQLLKAMPLVEGKQVRFVFLLAADALQQEKLLAPTAGLEWIQLNEGERQTGSQTDTPSPVSPSSHLPVALSPRSTPGALLSSSIRVDIHRLDEVMRLVGDLVVTRARLSDTIDRIKGLDPAVHEALDDTTGRIERQVRDLRQALMRVRLVPLAEVFGRMPLVVRDVANTSGKQVRLMMQGENTEIDKALVDRLLDPMLHLVRNAITHGIEMPDERRRAGKDPQGVITLTGQPEGDHVVITISDDGRGIDTRQVLQQARQSGWTPSGAADMQEVLDILCRPGFSTHRGVDMAAGRGIGMSVVQQTIAALGGSLALRSTPGSGTTFTIRLPLTLAIIDALIVKCGDESFAIPQSAINEAVEIDPAQVTDVMGQELLTLRGAPLPLVYLQRLFHLPDTVGGARRALFGLLTGAGDGRSALVVDRIIGLRESVVRPVSDPLVAQPGIAGATELGDGSLALVLDVPGVLRTSRDGKTRTV